MGYPPPPPKKKVPNIFFVKTEKIKVVQNCLKWQENWSQTIFGFLATLPPKKGTYKFFLSKRKKWKLFKIAWNGEKIGQKNRVPTKKIVKNEKIKVDQNCLILFDPKFVWPKFCRPHFFFGPTIFSDPTFFRPYIFSDPTFFQTQHFFRPKYFRTHNGKFWN